MADIPQNTSYPLVISVLFCSTLSVFGSACVLVLLTSPCLLQHDALISVQNQGLYAAALSFWMTPVKWCGLELKSIRGWI